MARVLWHGIGPWHKTGYGHQTALFAPLLRDLGHDVAIAYMGIRGVHDKPATAHPDAAEHLRAGHWHGIPLIGPGLTEFAMPGVGDIRAAFGGHDPDLVIVLKDAWVLSPGHYARYRTALWLVFDCEPLGAPDRAFFAAAPHVVPVAASRWGQSQARKAGLDARYVPHGIDLAAWTPGSQDDARELLGLPRGVFIAGIDAANIGPRKGWGEQLSAFAMFHAKHRDSLLLIHSTPEHPEGINLRDLVAHLELEDAVKFGSQANMTQLQMLNWYRSLSVLMQGSYGEGFGLPVIQALACGVPVIGTKCSAITEKIPAGAGHLVAGQRWWNPHHQAWWTIPSVPGLVTALTKTAARPPRPAPEHVAEYDAARVARECWKPLIEELTDAGA